LLVGVEAGDDAVLLVCEGAVEVGLTGVLDGDAGLLLVGALAEPDAGHTAGPGWVYEVGIG